MSEVARCRYKHEFPEMELYEWFKLRFFRISCLRELCQQIGVVLQCGEITHFQAHHIVSIEPVLKVIEIVSDDFRVNMELG
jgi:protein TIF31